MPFKKILLPVDGSKHSENAMHYAIQLAKLEGAKIKAISCYEASEVVPELPEDMIKDFTARASAYAKSVLSTCRDALEAAGVDYEVAVIDGAPGKVISDLAKSKVYDLVIMGSHGHSDIAGLFLGSVTHKVINTIYCPIMIVP